MSSIKPAQLQNDVRIACPYKGAMAVAVNEMQDIKSM